VPEVAARGQGGLLDVVLHPDYATNGWLYLSYARSGLDGAATAVSRARLDGDALRDETMIFETASAASGGRHFGSRIAFGPDGKLFVSVGDRGQDDEAQNLANHNGTVLRLNPDGSVPEDNPFAGRADALPSTFSYGHRNPQGMAVHPVSGEVWVHEHGPQGGDEINLLKPGANYGWPRVTFGRSYAGFPIGDGTSAPDWKLRFTTGLRPSRRRVWRSIRAAPFLNGRATSLWDRSSFSISRVWFSTGRGWCPKNDCWKTSSAAFVMFVRAPMGCSMC
jgi:glucose/arabinose dehydrogenase